MNKDAHEAENSPYSVSTGNQYSSLEDELNNVNHENFDAADISDDSIVIEKRLNKLKRKRKTSHKLKKAADQSETDLPDSDKTPMQTDNDSDPQSDVMLGEDGSEILVNCAELKPSPLMNVDIMVKETKIPALLDTGASSNMIKRSVIEKLQIPICPEERIIVGLGSKETAT